MYQSVRPTIELSIKLHINDDPCSIVDDRSRARLISQNELKCPGFAHSGVRAGPRLQNKLSARVVPAYYGCCEGAMFIVVVLALIFIEGEAAILPRKDTQLERRIRPLIRILNIRAKWNDRTGAHI